MTTETFGHLAALGCAATWAIATLLYGKAAQTVDARALNLWKCALSLALLGVTALVLDDIPSFSTRDAWALAASAVLGLLLADTAYFIALREIGPARGVLFVSLVPVTTALLAVPTLNEPLTPRMRSCPSSTLNLPPLPPSKLKRSHFVWSNSLPSKLSPHSSTFGAACGVGA